MKSSLSTTQTQLWRATVVTHTRLQGELTRRLGEVCGLSYQDFQVLALLSEAQGSELRISELGEYLGWESSRISHHVSRMASRGLVSKQRCEGDRRSFLVHLSAVGLSAYERAAPVHAQTISSLFFGALDDSQLEVLREVATAVGQKLDE